MFRATSIVIAAAVGISVLAAAAMQTERQQRDTADIETMEGIIVDLHHYMTMEETPDLDDRAAVAGKNAGGPVGLLVERERALLPNRTILYVVLVEPVEVGPAAERPGWGGPDDRRKADETAKAMFLKAQNMTGERVRITGKELERDNVRAIVVRTIDTADVLAEERD